MKQYVEDFTKHLAEAIKIGNEASFSIPAKTYQNILICGLGGSGIGGTIIAQLLSPILNIPVLVNKDYQIPDFVNQNTLVIASSYSGNTEETLEMLQQAEEKDAEIAVVSSGGKLIEISKQKKYNYIKIPEGFPPRAAFGLSFPQLFYVLHKYGIIDKSFESEIQKSIELLNTTANKIKEEARLLAEKLVNKIPVIYSAAPFEGVSVRFRQQLNENSKMLCWHHALPEMNHNELVGWAGGNENLAVVFFRNDNDYYRTQKRIEINKEIIAKKTPHIYEIYSKGSSNLERTLYMVHFGDWVSVYLAELKGIDAVEVNVITYLKGELAKI
jgi:glucose/mannose-6-phosphate isomerase